LNMDAATAGVIGFGLMRVMLFFLGVFLPLALVRRLIVRDEI